MSPTEPLEIARRYHRAWTTRQFAEATQLLSSQLTVEVPVNEYPTRESFGAALAGFGSLATDVMLLCELGDGREAMLLYDMTVSGLGQLRVAEHFTVENGQITRLRQIHDTAALRNAGFVP